MSDPKPQNLVMPSREQFVERALARLDTLGLRSNIVDLDTATLRGLCLRLTDRKVTVKQAYRWINTELGVDIEAGEAQVVDDNAVYRFASHFRRVFDQVRGEERRRISRLTVATATDSNIRSMTLVSQTRLAELMAERLVDVDNLEELASGELKNIMFSVKFAQETQHDTARLDLARRQADDRAAKLQAEVERLTLENDKRRRELQRAIEAAKKAVSGVVEGDENKSMTGDQVIAILDRVMKGETPA